MYNFPFMQNQGWVCPKCGRVWGPNVSGCNCHLLHTETSGTKATWVGTDPAAFPPTSTGGTRKES